MKREREGKTSLNMLGMFQTWYKTANTACRESYNNPEVDMFPPLCVCSVTVVSDTLRPHGL